VKHPPFNPEEVIQRLRDENTQLLGLIQEIQLILSSDKEFDGCTTLGGVKAMLKSLQEKREEIFCLEREIRNLKNKK